MSLRPKIKKMNLMSLQFFVYIREDIRNFGKNLKFKDGMSISKKN